MPDQAGARAGAHNARIQTTSKSGDTPEIAALRAKVEKQRAHLAGAELALAQAIAARKEHA